MSKNFMAAKNIKASYSTYILNHPNIGNIIAEIFFWLSKKFQPTKKMLFSRVEFLLWKFE
jgi:hypothetical protein